MYPAGRCILAASRRTAISVYRNTAAFQFAVTSINLPPLVRLSGRIPIARDMATTADQFSIEHSSADGKFFVTLEDGSKALLQYRLADGAGGRIVDITHTYTPPAGRGKGLAAKLSDAAFKYAKDNGMQIRPSCSYIRDTYIPANKGMAADFEYDEDENIAKPKL